MFPHLFRPARDRRPPSPGSAGGSLTRAALRAVAFAALGVLAGATAAPARADVFVDIDNGNKIDGDVRERVSAIDTRQCPLYLLTGEYDYSCSPEDTRDLERRIAGAKAVIMPGIGHFPMSEDPQGFLAHLKPVLDS